MKYILYIAHFINNISMVRLVSYTFYPDFSSSPVITILDLFPRPIVIIIINSVAQLEIVRFCGVVI